MSSTPIADHALLSDCHSAALVDLHGSVEWWCPPSFDSPSVFGRLLDDAAGHFSIQPAGDATVTRRYQAGSLVLVSTFRTAGGTLELTDGLAMAEGVRHHDLGMDSPSTLLRQARCTQGTVDLEIEFVPRLEYGLTSPVIRLEEQGLVARGGPVTLRLSTTAELAVRNAAARGRVTLRAGETVGFAVEHASSWDAVPEPWSQARIAYRLADTIEAWRSWEADHQRYQGAYDDLVHHSGRVLQALTYQPTGAIVAAPTTSLPEVIGGQRNWDYRFAWMRDASLTLDALWIAACPDEATSFVRYLTTVASTFHESGRLQIMFGIRGERDLAERSLQRLAGWRDSSPVRVGNDAWRQVQLDVYGELLGAFHRLRDRLEPFDELTQRFLTGLANAAAASWQQADHGIWEIRGKPDHYVHSKLMCWVALDRAIDLAPAIGAGGRVEHWTQVREEIRGAILEQGWSDESGAFTQTFGGTQLDASSLLIPIVGFLPASDPRVVATIEATARALTDDRGLVYRYRADDGMSGEEGVFLLCTYWLAEALARAGQTERAREAFDRATAYRNDVDLLSEEVDVANEELVGNFPQAFSHVGLVNAAWAITQAEQVVERPRPPGGLPHVG
ncbi:MAG: glycoside hydrolase family 15 protein [Actinomycetota bacterium]|nr:glycoside hydrolase family 15 protein [Actinomycetota bacterium]